MKTTQMVCVLKVVLAFFALVALSSSVLSDEARHPTEAVAMDQPLSQTHLTPQKEKALRDRMAGVRMPFMENRGQSYPSVAFYANTFGGMVFVTREGKIVYNLPKGANAGKKTASRALNPPAKDAESPVAGVVLQETFTGARKVLVTGGEPAATRVSYFKGKDRSKWQSDIATYNQIHLGEIYDGIELGLKAHGINVEKLFYIRPGADVDRIRVTMEGADRLDVNEYGELVANTALGQVRFTRPVAYQTIYTRGVIKRQAVEVAYRVEDNQYGFQVGVYDNTRKLVIDPLLASTFLGGSIVDLGNSLALDAADNVYITGATLSPEFPTTAGAYQQTKWANYDVFVASLTPDLTTLTAATFLKGAGRDYGNSLALNADGIVYLTGRTDSAGFPTTAGAYDQTHNGGDDVFVARLSADLTTLTAATFLGGSGTEYGNSLALSPAGNVYLTGNTLSTDFPTTDGAYDQSYNSGGDVFVARLSASLGTLADATFLGGESSETGYSLALSATNVYVTGRTQNWTTNFPTTAGAYDQTHNGRFDVFVAKLPYNLSTLAASTFLGGSNDDYGNSLALDAAGNVYVTGSTSYSVTSNFPTTAGAYDPSHNLNDDVFVARLNADLTTLTAATFLGGVSNESGNSLALDAAGNVYLTGYTVSTEFPTTAGAYDTSHDWHDDVFVARLSADLGTLAAATFLGGVQSDIGNSLALDAAGNVYLIGETVSPDFPTTDGAYDQAHNGPWLDTDVFVAKLTADLGAPADGIFFPVRSKDGKTAIIYLE